MRAVFVLAGQAFIFLQLMQLLISSTLGAQISIKPNTRRNATRASPRALQLARQQRQQQQQQTLEYAVVVDCGSSGTRATIYTWPVGTESGQLAYNIKPLMRDGKIVTSRIRPGLASVRDNPNYASDYMRPLMEFASKNVPPEKQASAPVYILGTAGMRLLTSAERKAIEDDLRNDLPRDFVFQNIQAEVISGLEEGLFQWVSINAIVSRLTTQFDLPRGGAINLFVPPREDRTKRRRLALIEVGGASAQVAFETSSSMDDLLVRRLKHHASAWRVYRTSGRDLYLYGDERPDVSVFSVSFLGFGSDKARELAVDLLVRESLQLPAFVVGNSAGLPLVIAPNATLVLQDPCLAEGAEESALKPIELSYGRWKTVGYQLKRRHRSMESVFHVRLIGAGNYAACQSLLNRLAKVAKVERTTCKLGSAQDEQLPGIVQQRAEICEAPLIGTNFVPWKEFQFVGLGELHHTNKEMFNTSGQFDGPLFVRNTVQLCATSWRDLQARLPADNEFEQRRNLLACFKATWLLTWLATILRIPLGGKHADVDFITTSQLAGVEVDWKLGAIITKTIELAGGSSAAVDASA